MKELDERSTAPGPANDPGRIERLRAQLAAGTYAPDPAAVASALLARLAALRRDQERGE